VPNNPILKRKWKKFCEQQIAYFPLIWHNPHKTRRLQKLFVVAETSLPSCCLTFQRGIHKQTHGLFLIRNEPQRKRRIQILMLLRVLCRRNVFIEPLPSNDKGINFTEPLSGNGRMDTHTDTQIAGRDLWSTPLRWAQVFYVPCLMKIGSGIQKLIGGTHIHTDSLLISLTYFRKVNCKR
jgi:hypothetical protein